MKNTVLRWYILIFSCLTIVFTLLEFSKTEVTNWSRNLSPDKKSPFGLYVFDQEAPRLFKGKFYKIGDSPYDYYSKKQEYPHNILLVEPYIDPSSWNKILKQVAQGSDLLYISEYADYYLKDTLKFEDKRINFDEEKILRFTDRKLQNIRMSLNKMASGNGFSFINKQSEILGTVSSSNDSIGANFIKIKYGKGHVYVHMEPIVLTNYYLLGTPQGKYYVENIFSFLPDRKTLWFTEIEKIPQSVSPMRFILANPPLKYAWWLFLLGLLLFVLFRAKRKQRVIPILQQPRNHSAEFVKSVGNLYLQEGDFHDMMLKKIQYFLYRVRTELLIDTSVLDEYFAKKIQIKTGASQEIIAEALELIQKTQSPQPQVMQEDLLRLKKILDEILP